MFNDLSKYGIIPRKTYTITTPKLDEQFYSHYIRGYFDGDGCITCSNENYQTPSRFGISISGYENNLISIQNILLKNDIKSNITIDKREDKYNGDQPFGSLSLNSIKDKYNFIHYIYNDYDDLYIARKKYLADCFLTAIKNNYSNKQNIYNKLDNAVLNETTM